MERKLIVVLNLICLIVITSCSDKKEVEKAVKLVNEEYNKLLPLQKKMESEKIKYSAERDTLLKDLKKVKGSLSTEVVLFSEKVDGLLSRQSELTSKHYELMGKLAKLEDEIAHGEMEVDEGLKKNKIYLYQSRKIAKSYQSLLKERENLLNEFRTLTASNYTTLK